MLKATAFVGLCRFLLKPFSFILANWLQDYVAVAIARKQKLSWLGSFLANPGYIFVSWVLDYIISLKLPKYQEVLAILAAKQYNAEDF